MTLILFIIMIASLLVTALIIPFLIRYFKSSQLGQVTREEGPSWHEVKSGTPTMGGLGILIATLLVSTVPALLTRNFTIELFILLFAFLSFGLIGFLDDFIKLFKKQNLGLTSGQKFIAQILFGIVTVGLIFYFTNAYDLSSFISSVSHFYQVSLLLYFVLMVIWMVGFSNATNLTDGIDGLMSSTGAIAYLFYAWAALQKEQLPISLFAFVVAGSLLGFLIFNKKPAKIFMGDVGSLALGAGLAVISILLNMEWSLLLVGFVFVMETASVIIQVTHFKRTGKRIFKMTPIHHHFEMSHWSEEKIVAIFSGITLFGCLLTYILM